MPFTSPTPTLHPQCVEWLTALQRRKSAHAPRYNYQLPILEVMCNVAVSTDGQAALTHAGAGYGHDTLMELIEDMVRQGGDLKVCAAATLFLRHLAFLHENKALVLRRPALVEAVLARLMHPANSPQGDYGGKTAGRGGAEAPGSGAARRVAPAAAVVDVLRVQAMAASAIWALCYNHQKAIRCIRQLSSHADLQAVMTRGGGASSPSHPRLGRIEATRDECIRSILAILATPQQMS